MVSNFTVNVFSNTHILTNIHSYDHSISIRCNTGILAITQVGDLKGFGMVWYNNSGI